MQSLPGVSKCWTRCGIFESRRRNEGLSLPRDGKSSKSCLKADRVAPGGSRFTGVPFGDAGVTCWGWMEQRVVAVAERFALLDPRLDECFACVQEIHRRVSALECDGLESLPAVGSQSVTQDAQQCLATDRKAASVESARIEETHTPIDRVHLPVAKTLFDAETSHAEARELDAASDLDPCDNAEETIAAGERPGRELANALEQRHCAQLSPEPGVAVQDAGGHRPSPTVEGQQAAGDLDLPSASSAGTGPAITLPDVDSPTLEIALLFLLGAAPPSAPPWPALPAGASALRQDQLLDLLLIADYLQAPPNHAPAS